MLNNLLHQYQAGDLNIFQVLQHMTDIEYRLDRNGQYKNVLLTFGNEILCTESDNDPTIKTINEVYRLKFNLMKGRIPDDDSDRIEKTNY